MLEYWQRIPHRVSSLRFEYIIVRTVSPWFTMFVYIVLTFCATFTFFGLCSTPRQLGLWNLTMFFPLLRKKHVSAILNIRGLTRQRERQEILNIVKDIESSDGGSSLAQMSRDRALFSEVPVTSEAHCLNLGMSRIALTASSCFSSLRPRRPKTRTPVQENPDEVL